MPTTVNKGYSVQTTGSNVGTWGTELNTNALAVVDLNLGGSFTKSLSSSNYTLSTTEAQSLIWVFTGTLTANIVITTTTVGMAYVRNNTTGAFTLTISNGVGSGYIVPRYAARQVVLDSNGVLPVGLAPPGTLVPFGGVSLPVDLSGEYVLAAGQLVSRTGPTASLFAIYGTTYGAGDGSTTFAMPDLRGRAIFGLDNMGGSAANRVTNAGSGIAGTTLGASGGAENVTLTSSQIPASGYSATTTVANGTSVLHGTLFSTTGGTDLSGVPIGASSSTVTASTTVTVPGGGGNHTNMPPAFMMNILVKL